MAKSKSKGASAPDQTSADAEIVEIFDQMSPERQAFFPLACWNR